MKRVTLLILFCLIAGCSVSNEEKLIKDIRDLKQDNSVVDTLVNKTDSVGNFETILGSFRNDKDPRGLLIYEILDQLFSLGELSEKPKIPRFYTGIHISLQNKESLESYKVDFLVDSELTHIKLISIQSNDYNKIEYSKYLEMTDELRKKILKIINVSST